jgi:hypothetical protein
MDKPWRVMRTEQPKLALTDLKRWKPQQNSKALLIIFGLMFFLPLIAVLGPYVLKAVLAPSGSKICVDAIDGAVTYCILFAMQWPFAVLAVAVVRQPDAKYINWAAGGALIGLLPPYIWLHLIFAAAPFDYACRFKAHIAGEALYAVVILSSGIFPSIVAFILGILGWLIGRTYGLRASVASLLELARALIAIALVVQLSLVLSAPAADCQGLDVQATVDEILVAKGRDVIDKKYSKLFAALKEQTDGSDIAKQQELEFHELGRLNTTMTTFYPDVLEDIRTVSRKPYLNAVTCAARVKADDPSISAYKEFEYDVHETIFGALRVDSSVGTKPVRETTAEMRFCSLSTPRPCLRVLAHLFSRSS